jgi:hypothetical protein
VDPFSIKFVEAATNGLPSKAYREGAEVRSQKRDLGLRRATASPKESADTAKALTHLSKISSKSSDPILRTAAVALSGYLQ